MIRYLIILVQD